eukprot:10930356-Prorocentrum_lima.AAC.1
MARAVRRALPARRCGRSRGKTGRRGKPRRYTELQEREIVAVYKRLRENPRMHPTLENLRQQLKRKTSLHPLPTSKSTFSGILQRAGLKWYRMRRGQCIDETIAQRRLKEAKKMVRRPKKSWRSKVLFLDFKKFVPRTSQRQKEYQ